MCWVNAVMKSFRAHMSIHHCDVLLQLETAVSGIQNVETTPAKTMAVPVSVSDHSTLLKAYPANFFRAVGPAHIPVLDALRLRRASDAPFRI